MNDNETDYDMPNIDPDILEKASGGDPSAQLTLGKAYYTAVHIENNSVNAFQWFSLSAEIGNMEAQFRLGDLYALGQGTKTNFVDAYRWYTKAALQGYKKALIRIHNLYQEDKKMHCHGQLNSDEEEWASDEFKEKNNIRELYEYRLEQQASILNHAMEYYFDQFKFCKTSEEDHKEAQLYLGFYYQHGYGVRKNMLLAIDAYTKAAEQGHKDAQYNLGYLYQHNTNIKFNYRHAFKWYRLSATSGNIAAQHCLGYFYEKGLGTEINWEGALYWYTRAANSGDSSAQLTLGKFYRKGQGIDQNISEAAKWYKLAASQGNNAAQNCLNQLYLCRKLPEVNKMNTVSGHAIEPPTLPTLSQKLQADVKELVDSPKIKRLIKLVQRTLMVDGSAMYHIGLKYYYGEDLPQNKHIGFQWIKKAAKTGLQEAQNQVAKMYQTGDTIDQDYHASSIWFQKLAWKKNDSAQCNIGKFYKDGIAVRKDPLEASKWFTISAEKGNSEAEYQLGILRYYGLGLRQDKQEAVLYILRSSFKKNSEALWKVGYLYEKGIILNKDILGAITAYAHSAKLGNKEAQFRLGEIFEEGKVVEQDLSKANYYYTMAASSGDPLYQTKLAFKYINGVFQNQNYIKAFDLMKKAAHQNYPEAKLVFEPPIEPYRSIHYYSDIIPMLICASKRGEERVDYLIGYALECFIKLKSKPDDLYTGYSEVINWYRIASNKGDSRAQYRLGRIFEDGQGVNVDLTSAINYYYHAHENGNGDAAYRLGLIYLNGDGASSDFQKAFNLFTDASIMGNGKAYEELIPSKNSVNLRMLEAVASQGFVAVQYQLCTFYENNDDLRSFKWMSLAIEGRITDAYYRLGLLYEEGRGTYRDYSRAIKLYEIAAAQNHEDAMYKLAQMYHYGVGTSLDYGKAYELYNKAANLNHCLSLKILNITGKANSKTYKENNENSAISSLAHESANGMFPSASEEFKHSLMMYKYIAEQGNVEAQYKLGIAYEDSFSDPNYTEAVNWYTMAAQNSHRDAKYRLGLLYEQGLGVTQNYQEATRLYQESYEQGNYDVLYKLGTSYHQDTSADINRRRAFEYYYQAANNGQHDAQFALGTMYEQGEMVEKNILEALLWYTKSHMQGHEDAIYRLFDIYNDPPLESYFYTRLYKILYSLLEYNASDSYNANTGDKNNEYGRRHYDLGYLCFHGIGTIVNYSLAWKHLNKSIRIFKYKDKDQLLKLDSIQKLEMQKEAADKNDVNAQYNVGKYHFIQATQSRLKLQKEKNKTIINDKTELGNDDAISTYYKSAIHYFSLAASNGHPDSQFHLGKIYQNGYGTAIDYEQAKLWYTESSGKKHQGALHSLGMLYANELAFENNYPEAFMNLNKTAEEGNANSSFQLGWMYQYGIGIMPNEDEASIHFKNSIEAMIIKSYTNNAIKSSSSLSEDDVDQDDNQKTDQDNDVHYVDNLDDMSLTELQELSDKGNGEASYTSSQKYLDENNVEKDIPKSMSYLRKAAHQGHSVSQEQLALSYYYGNNIVKDIRIATMWFRTAAKNEENISMLYLGQIFHCGLLDKYDFSGAFKLYKAVDGIYCSATLREIGLLYEYGDGIKSNPQTALTYYQESFKEGNTLSGYNIALLYFHGKGVKQDYRESMYWLKKALIITPTLKDLPYVFIETENSSLTSLENQPNRKYSVVSCDTLVGEIHYLLGIIYYEGLGVQQDADKSFGCFSKADKKGKAEARIQLNEIEEARRQLKKIEDDKIAKSKLEKIVVKAKPKLTIFKDDKEKLKISKSMKINWSEIEEMILQLEEEINKAELLMSKSDEDLPRSAIDFEEASKKVTTLLNSVNKVIVEQIEINKSKLLLGETIEKAEVQVGKKKQQRQLKDEIRKAKSLLARPGDKPLQKTELDDAITRLEEQLMIL